MVDDDDDVDDDVVGDPFEPYVDDDVVDDGDNVFDDVVGDGLGVMMVMTVVCLMLLVRFLVTKVLMLMSFSLMKIHGSWQIDHVLLHWDMVAFVEQAPWP